MSLRGVGVSATAGWRTPFYQNDAIQQMPFWMSFFISYDGTPADTHSYPIVLSGGTNTSLYVDCNGLTYSSPPIIGAGLSIRNDAGTTVYGSAPPWVTVGEWQHATFVFASLDRILVYYNGKLIGQQTTSGSFLLNTLKFGSQSHTTQLIAELCIGAGVLSDERIQALAYGRNPLNVVDPDKLIRYFPLRDNFNDRGRQRIGAVPDVGAPAPTWAAHPMVEPAPEEAYGFKSVGGGGGGGGGGVNNRPRILLVA